MAYSYDRIAADDDDKDREHKEKRLQAELEKHARGAGKVKSVQWRGSGSWAAVFDTEYAALKVYYKYKDTPGVRLGKAGGGGWHVSIGR